MTRDKVRGAAVGVVAMTCVALLAYWAGTKAIATPSIPTGESSQTTYEVLDGSVSDTVRLSMDASWDRIDRGYVRASGVVTSVNVSADRSVRAGEVIASVNLVPVVVAEGGVPMFRTLEVGRYGPDVKQLENLLVASGKLRELADATFDGDTREAVKSWQAALGAPVTGTVSPWSVIFLSGLPRRIAVLAKPGESVSPEQAFLEVLSEQPTIVGHLSPGQRTTLTTGLEVSIDVPDGTTIVGRLGEFETLGDGQEVVSIVNFPCPRSCGFVDINGKTALTGIIAVVPPIFGPVVPMSAMVLAPSGGLEVNLENGTRRAVSVIGQANGFAVVDGIAVGERITLPVQ